MDLRACLVLVTQFWWGSLTLGKRYDILQNNEISWISEENLTVVVEYSFPESRCCIVHVRKNATRTEQTMLKWFSTNYRGQEYLTRRKTYVCADHLLISSNSSELTNSLRSIPVAEASTRILVLIDSRLEVSSVIFNASIYVNSNVNLLCRNGSYVLSENYLEPRRFKIISRFKELQRKTGIADFQGRAIQASTYYSPPFSFLKSTVNKTIGGVSAAVFVPVQEKEIDGIELNIFMIIAKTLNFTYTIRKPIGRYNHGRKYNDTVWIGGMVGQIVRKEVDLAFSNIWINLDNSQFVNLTKPWTQVFLHFLVPRPKAFTSFWALTRPLSPSVWFVILGALGLKTIYIYAKAKINPLVPKRFRNVVVTFTELLGRMLGTWLPPIAPQVRLQFILWELAGFLIVTIYCSSLAARLTNPDFEQRIDTVRQFIEKKLTWGREITAPHFKEYFDLSDKWAKQMPSRFILEKSSEDRMNRIFQGNYGVIGRIVGDVYYPENSVTNEALEVLRVMRNPVGQFYTGFAVQPWLLEPVNTVMMRLKESGIILYQMVHVVHRRTGTHLREVFIEHDNIDFNKFIDLAINPLGVGFAILIFGLLLATLVFYSEVRAVQGKATFLETLRGIRRRQMSETYVTLRNESM
ncbi:glutamate receptor U1 isoform X2 [Nasonia vitripennis]|uniref:Ionotropic glutamate receptor L-glutamate and glycine-binding domain-containing protein n=1 Tax=Nasonia vitripennis TaxID=7425 RepID=A0A7M7QG48_NASVI|nr:glutamate receptor U1 isoform X2 [Nasonia vitripennis]